MNYLSVCSGIEAATVAWHPLGWKPFAFSEIERFPSEVLAHHYPNTPNFGDMTKFKEWPDANINVFVGGTPCQSFSVAGLRKGLDDPRGNLMLTYLAIAAKYRPKWVVWENVPGVLSSNRGLDFATFLRGLGECGYGFAYRILDAQYFGVPQRRRRVFVVGCLGDWRSAAAVLFERHSLQGHTAPSREQGEKIAKCLTAGTGQRNDPETEEMIVKSIYSLQGSGTTSKTANGSGWNENVSFTLNKVDVHGVVQPTIIHGTQDPCTSDIAFAQGRNNGGENVLMQSMTVRRLTPMECERLQGFPDGYTDIKTKGKPTPDGPRYKALGNSMAVPVMAWIGKRIQMVEDL
jgi:DNA (cytosine-5)-methyltransferase 1